MSHPKRCHAKQLTLQPKQIAIAAAHMEQRRDSKPFLEHRADGTVAHPEDGQRVVRKRNCIASRLHQRLSTREIFFQGERPWRIKFANDNTLAGRDSVEKAFLCRRMPFGAGARSGSTVTLIDLLRTGSSPANAAAIAAIVRGVVPQHPPTSRAPCATISRAIFEK